MEQEERGPSGAPVFLIQLLNSFAANLKAVHPPESSPPARQGNQSADRSAGSDPDCQKPNLERLNQIVNALNAR